MKLGGVWVGQAHRWGRCVKSNTWSRQTLKGKLLSRPPQGCGESDSSRLPQGPPAEGGRDSPENETRTRYVGGDPEQEATLPCGPPCTAPPVGMTLSHEEGPCLPADTPCGFHQLTGRQVQPLQCASGHKEWAGPLWSLWIRSVWETPTLKFINGDCGLPCVYIWVSGCRSTKWRS